MPRQGIRSIGAFLASSKELRVLWSAPYLKRLSRLDIRTSLGLGRLRVFSGKLGFVGGGGRGFGLV